MSLPIRIVSLVSDNKAREAMAFALESQVGAMLIPTATTAQCLETFLKEDQVDLFICEFPGESEAVIKYLAAVGRKLSIIALQAPKAGKTAPEVEKSVRSMAPGLTFKGVVAAPHDIQMVVALGKVVAAETHKEEQLNENEFVRIRVDLLQGLRILQADVYIKLGADKFVRLYRMGDPFNAQDRQRFLTEKKIEFLFVKRGESAPVVGFLREELLKRIEVAKNAPPAAAEATVSKVQESALEIISKLGVTPEVKEVIKSNMMLSIRTMGSNPKLKGLLAKINTDREKYLSSHSVLLSQVSCAISAAMDWGSTSTFQKLTMAAFLHDATLTDQASALRLERCKSKQEVQEEGAALASTEMKQFLMHPADAATMVQQFDELPPDVDTIIHQHHERPDGSGYPRGLTHRQLAPLSTVFIIAHDLITEMYATPPNEKFSMEKFVEKMTEAYSQGNFRKVVVHLRGIHL